MAPKCETVTLLPFVHRGDWDLSAIRTSFSRCKSLPLRQSWLARNEHDFQPGQVQAGWSPEDLHIFVDLEDSDIVTAPKLVSGASLVVADIFQVFLARPEEDDYLEIHVTPDNTLRVIAWTPDRLARFQKGGMSLDEITQKEGERPVSQTWVEKEEGSWRCYLRIPIALIHPSQGRAAEGRPFRGTFCRFDAAFDSETPILSSTSNFREGPRFHDSTAWHDLLPAGSPTG